MAITSADERVVNYVKASDSDWTQYKQNVCKFPKALDCFTLQVLMVLWVLIIIVKKMTSVGTEFGVPDCYMINIISFVL
jgi:hypothetical protein